MKIDILPVTSNKDLIRFIKCQNLFYDSDKNFVRPIVADRKSLLDTKKNPFYKHSEIQCFIAARDGKIVGRIAAITNENHNKTHNDNAGFFGFFECENNPEVASELFATAEKWLRSKGKNKIIGPENPSMNDEIGLLIDGFDSPPMILMTYNPQYYIDLIEGSGFKKAKDVYAYGITPSYASDKLIRLHDLVRERYKIKIRNFNFKNKTQFHKDVETFKSIYNAAWVPNWGFVKWTDEEIDKTANDLKMFANPDFALIAESNGKVAGMALALPNINECMIHNRTGSIVEALWNYMTKKKKIKSLRIIVLGVLPEFQKIGLDSVLYYEIGERAIKAGMTFGEASWILEDNTMMNRALTVTMNANVYKTYRLYEKNLI